MADRSKSVESGVGEARTRERRGRVTEILMQLVDGASTEQGDGECLEDPTSEILPYVYDELRALARRHLSRESSAVTIEPTALVHEVYLRLVDPDAGWQSRAHFFGAAGRAMRRILVDHARRRSASKRGGDADRVPLGDAIAVTLPPSLDVLALDEALAVLAERDSRLATVVDLRYFAGMSTGEVAQALDLSERSVVRDWRCARAWLVERLGRESESRVGDPPNGR